MATLRQFARQLRNNATETEVFLWKHLKSRQIAGCKFRRQATIGNYIVDFVCYEQRVIVECDGSQHMDNAKEDAMRDQWFIQQGYRILRFWNNEVLQNVSGVLQIILEACQSAPSPLSPPMKGGEGRGAERDETVWP